MPTLRLTRRNIATIRPEAKPVIWFDTDVKGFGLKIQPTGSRSWIVEYRPGAGGRGVAKKRIKIGGEELPPEMAREAATKLLASVSLGADPAGGRASERAAVTVTDLIDMFLERHVERKRKASSAASYRGIFNVHVKPTIGAKRAPLVTRADIDKMHTSISAKTEGDRRRGGIFVANKALAIISAMYGWAAGVGLVPEGFNPASRVERFKEHRRERFLNADELGRIGSALLEAETIGLPYEVDETTQSAKHNRKPENRRVILPRHVTGAIRLLMFTGCRLREILHLEWSHIDFQRGIAFLPDSKTGKKAIVLPDPALLILKELPRLGRYVVASQSAGLADENPRADLKKPWAAVSRHAGLHGVRLHDLRHSYASVGAGSGMGLPIIGKLLGHANPSTTQRYAHLDADPVRVAANAIADKISASMGEVR